MQRIMSQPEWNGIPDIDFVFYLGVLFRVALAIGASGLITVMVLAVKNKILN